MFTEDDVIHCYTRAQALADGELIDASTMAKEAGIRVPVALTREAWVRYVEFDADDGQGQSIDGRLWDVLWMFRTAARAFDGDVLEFRLHVAKRNRGDWQSNEAVPERDSGLSRESCRLVTLKAHIGPGDTAEPVITIMLPRED